MKIIPGSGAIVQATFNQNYGVQAFTVVNGGTGYATTNPPKVVILGTTTPTIAGSFYPIIADGQIKSIRVLSSGSGYYPVISGLGTAVGIASIGSANNDVRSIYITNPGFGYTVAPQVTIGNPNILTGYGNYEFNEVIVGSRSKTKARVKEWDSDAKILKISYVGIGATTKGFVTGENIVGTKSGAIYSVKTFNQQDTYDKYSQNDEIEEESDFIIDFSESNPFGTY